MGLTLAHAQIFMRLTVLAADLLLLLPALAVAMAQLRHENGQSPPLLEAADDAGAGAGRQKGKDERPRGRRPPVLRLRALQSHPATALLVALLQPCLLLIDHGHFQYNGVCLALCTLAAVALARGAGLGSRPSRIRPTPPPLPPPLHQGKRSWAASYSASHSTSSISHSTLPPRSSRSSSVRRGSGLAPPPRSEVRDPQPHPHHTTTPPQRGA